MSTSSRFMSAEAAQATANGLRSQRRSSSRFREYLYFIRAFLRAPGTVGSVCPSSQALAAALIAGEEFRCAGTVVELGPGTGPVTRAILDRLDTEATFFALELDGRSVERLRQDFPGIDVYRASAEAISTYLTRHAKSQADYVVSGLPWALMDQETQGRIMREVARSLSPDGVFAAFTYLVSPLTLKGRRFARILHRLFAEVKISSVVWRNLPPAIVYRCRKPRQHDLAAASNHLGLAGNGDRRHRKRAELVL